MSENTQLAQVERPAPGIMRAADPGPLLVFTPQDLEVINTTIAKDLTAGERAFFIQACQSTGLNPLLKEIHVWKDGGKLVLHTGIDGLCKTAANHHPDYCGIEGPYWCGEDGAWRDLWLNAWGDPVAAKARVLLRGARTGFYTVMWENFAKPKTLNGKPTMWGKMGAHMLGVTATRHALRRTCPRAQKQIDMLALSDELDTSAANSLQSRVTEDPTPALAPGSVKSDPAPTQPSPRQAAPAEPAKRSADAGLSGTWQQRASAKFSALGGTKETALWHVQQILPGIKFLAQVDDAGWQRVANAFDAHECLPGEPGWSLEAEMVDETSVGHGEDVADDPFRDEP